MERGGMGRASNQPGNKFSKNMNEEEKATLREFLGKDAYALCCGTVHLVKNDPKAQRQLIQQGTICFVKDYAMKTYSLRLFDLQRRMQLWQETLSSDFSLHHLPSKENVLGFGFDGDACSYELNFSFIDEARMFKQRWDKYQHRRNRPAPFLELDDNPSKGAPRKFRNQKLTKSDIGSPLNFKHVVHVGWEPNGLAAKTETRVGEQLDPCVAQVLDKIGIPTDKLGKKEKKYIYDIIDAHGGMEQLKKEMEKSQVVSQSRTGVEEESAASLIVSQSQEDYIPDSSGVRPQRPPRNRDRHELEAKNLEAVVDESEVSSEVEEEAENDVVND